MHGSSLFARFVAVAVGCLALTAIAVPSLSARDIAPKPVPPLYTDQKLFDAAIAVAAKYGKTRPGKGERVTGITVPHHLLAPDLLARGFAVTAAFKYDKVILVSPEHFYKARRPMATTLRNFETVYGEVPVRRDHVARLLEDKELFESSELFAKEHGIGALLPFLKHYLPDTPIVPIAISVNAREEHWRRAIDLLKPMITPRTLIVQSTDYSHYLDWPSAVQRDQETLNVLTAGRIDMVPKLHQPDHLDSKAAEYIQMTLQRDIFGATATVIANRNSAEYAISTQNKSTSYIVRVFAKSPAFGSRLAYDDQEIVYFGGDFFPGRYMLSALTIPEVRTEIVRRVHEVTHGRPVIVNLETVLLRAPPPGIDPKLHFAHADLAIPLMKALNIRAVSLANNHANDLGKVGFDETVSVLKEAGITVLGHMEPKSVGRLGIVAMNFIGKNDYRGYPAIRDAKDIARLCQLEASSPLVVFPHWGAEYTRTATEAEFVAAQAMHDCGAGLIVGHHSHQAAERVRARQGGAYQVLFSLGNFLFDQTSQRASSALLEVRLFRQGTYATRLIPIDNLYEAAQRTRQAHERRHESRSIAPPAMAPQEVPIEINPRDQKSGDFLIQRGQK